MKKYGGYSFKDRKRYLCENNIIIKERFTCKVNDYLKNGWLITGRDNIYIRNKIFRIFMKITIPYNTS